jgi:hypothetical protein
MGLPNSKTLTKVSSDTGLSCKWIKVTKPLVKRFILQGHVSFLHLARPEFAVPSMTMRAHKSILTSKVWPIHHNSGFFQKLQPHSMTFFSKITFSAWNLLSVTKDAATLSTMTFSITTLSVMGLFATFSIMSICIKTLYHYAKCYYAECRYAEYRGAQTYFDKEFINMNINLFF